MWTSPSFDLKPKNLMDAGYNSLESICYEGDNSFVKNKDGSRKNIKLECYPYDKERKFRCYYNMCQKSFNKLDHLKTHLRTHTGEKPYCCGYSQCGKAFNDLANLKRHYRIHTGEKPFKCNYPGCSKRFSVSSNLKQHKRTHTGERPYTCHICNKKFGYISSQKKHFAAHFEAAPTQPLQHVDASNYMNSNNVSHNSHKVSHNSYNASHISSCCYSGTGSCCAMTTCYPYRYYDNTTHFYTQSGASPAINLVPSWSTDNVKTKRTQCGYLNEAAYCNMGCCTYQRNSNTPTITMPTNNWDYSYFYGNFQQSYENTYVV